VKELIEAAQDDATKLDLLSLRNAIMLYNALKVERNREVAIV